MGRPTRKSPIPEADAAMTLRLPVAALDWLMNSPPQGWPDAGFCRL